MGSSENVVIFGTGRSGTTWLAEIIAAAGLKLIFEPLHPVEVPEVKGFPFPNYLLPGDETPWEPLLRSVVEGRVENEWTVRANPGASRAVVKLIRGNLMMEWMMDRFVFQPVYLVRNPLSVAGSMKEQGWDVGDRFVRYAMERIREKDGSFEGLEVLFDHPISRVEAFAIMWGYQNAIPLRRGLHERVIFVRFEDLVRDPDTTFGEVASRLGIEVTPEVREHYRKLSFQRGKQSWEKGYDPTRAWKRSLTPGEVEDVCRIVTWFGLGEYLLLD